MTRAWTPLALLASTLALLGAAPAKDDHAHADHGPYPNTLPNFREAASRPRGDRPQMLVRPPTDPLQYEAAVDRIRSTPGNELFAFAAYEGVIPSENMGEQNRVGTAMLRMASLSLPVPPEKVFENYRVWLNQRRLPIITGNPGPNTAHLTFRDPSDGFMRSVTVLGQGENTLIVAAVGDPKKMLEQAPLPTSPADWPLPPTLGRPVDFESLEGERRQRTRFASVGCRDAGDLLSFFETHLPEQGWAAEQGTRSSTPTQAREQFRRADTICDVTSALGRVEGRQACTLNVVCISKR